MKKYCVLASLLLLTSCGSGLESYDEYERTDYYVKHKSMNVIQNVDPGFNVRQRENLFKRTASPIKDTFKKNFLTQSSLSARSICYVDSIQAYKFPGAEYCSIEGGLPEDTGKSRGSGKLVGYNTLLTAHHVGLYDNETDVYIFGNSEFVNTGDGPPALNLDNLSLRERLYRLGFNEAFSTEAVYNSAIFDFDENVVRDFRTWSFHNKLDYYVSSSYDGTGGNALRAQGAKHGNLKRDVLLEVSDKKCFFDNNLSIHGPGIIFDWDSLVHQGDFIYPKDKSSVAALHANDHSIDEFPHSLVSLPGLYSNDSNAKCGQVSHNSCMRITDYQNCFATTLDLTGGSSGGAAMSDTLAFAESSQWGVLQGIINPVSVLDSWGYELGDDNTAPFYDYDNVNVSLFGGYTSVVSLSSKIDSDVRKTNGGQGTSNPDELPLPPYKPESVPPQGEFVVDITEDEGCYGCENKPAEPVKFSCTQHLRGIFRHWPEKYPDGTPVVGSAIGVVGSPFYKGSDSVVGLANIGLMCAVRSSYPYSDFWNYVALLMGVSSHEDDEGRIGIFSFPFSKSMNGSWIKHPVEGHKTMPFQACAPGYLLKGLTLLTSRGDVPKYSIKKGSIAGIESIECEKIYQKMPGSKDIVTVPIEPPANSSNNPPDSLTTVKTYLGVPSESQSLFKVNKSSLRCSKNRHVTGIFVDTNSSAGSLQYLELMCSDNPPKLNLNHCKELGDFSAKPISNNGQKRPSCVVPDYSPESVNGVVPQGDEPARNCN